jgi:hypothetical protein
MPWNSDLHTILFTPQDCMVRAFPKRLKSVPQESANNFSGLEAHG